MTATYASLSDVKRILQNRFSFNSDTGPNGDQVNATIEDVEDEINQTTQHAWKEIKVIEEFYDWPFNDYPRVDYLSFRRIGLRHRKLRTLDTNAGDKIEVWNGDEYEDWIVTRTEGRENDYWIDAEQGILYLRRFYSGFRQKGIRLTYRYGETTVPKDIRRATAYMVSIELIQNDDKSVMLNDTGNTNLAYISRLDKMQEKVDKILLNRTEIIVV